MIFCLPVFAVSVISAAIRSAVALALDASAVVISGSTGADGQGVGQRRGGVELPDVGERGLDRHRGIGQAAGHAGVDDEPVS